MAGDRMNGKAPVDGTKLSEDGVSAPATKKNNKGQWLPGISGNPNGRPPKAQEQAYLVAVTTAATPAQVQETIQYLLSHPSSWRARAAALELCLHYGLGKPIQRTMNVENTLADILAMIPDDAGSDEPE